MTDLIKHDLDHIKDYEEFRKQFKCKECGKCCQNFNAQVVLFGKECIPILQLMRFPLSVNLNDQTKITMKITLEGAPCIHFNPLSKLCRDYLCRPDLCRNYFCEDSRIKGEDSNGLEECE